MQILKINLLRIPLLLVGLAMLVACGAGSSDSGGNVAATTPGQNIPPEFVGVYRGTLNYTASAIGISESGSFPITITVMADGTIRFDGDDPDETFTVGITDAGDFAGELTVNEDPCQGTIAVNGSVNGTSASGTIDGQGECTDSGLTLDVDLDGDFSASK